jgi:hypothetical protein
MSPLHHPEICTIALFMLPEKKKNPDIEVLDAGVRTKGVVCVYAVKSTIKASSPVLSFGAGASTEGRALSTTVFCAKSCSSSVRQSRSVSVCTGHMVLDRCL